ncbi:hypothetical protein PHJA_002465000 [Phtheirospermum japonicum]|uniref:Uncharacterized protein n=1 Tax=Phtheirospermum japonicum TaxID=374723 RepID=A0A830DA41_9LAMI|nr:hypothetical protein PHJA_002465000 [Phtheirospermum japonicum]
MKDIQLQTPQRDQTSTNRRSKSTSDLSKNPRKAQVSRKKLSPAFQAASEDESSVLESLKEFPKVSDDNPFVESAENFIALVDPVDTPSSQTAAISDLTSPTLSTFSVITSENHVSFNATDTKCENSTEADFFDEIKSIETEVVIKHLREARIRVLKSKDVGSSKKILDALIKIAIEELYGGVHEENEWLDKLLSGKANVVVLSLMMGIYAIFMLWFFNSDAKGFRSTGPTPT